MSENQKKPDTSDINVTKFEALTPPHELWAKIPAGAETIASVASFRDQYRRCLRGDDKRFVVIVGPCSIHDEKLAMEYAEKLKAIESKVAEKVFVIMRVYFEKPRTTVGWKGLINDPHLNGSYDISHGLEKGRQVLKSISELGLPCATEFLDPIVPHYTSDFVTWAAIGARTTESQTHREMVSGLSMPVGFKNGTDGNVDTAINAMISARSPHSFLGIDQEGRTSIVRTKGNPDVHVVLRGGKQGSNYDPVSVLEITENIEAHRNDITRPLLVDCSHGNSNKDYKKQGIAFRSLVDQARQGDSTVLGAMLESHLVAGKQSLTSSLTWGQSITDGCIDIEETERLLLHAADQL
ncbi:MAG: 3-deoxy-7-phosphoheptulonate synthase [Pseudobacteriovorax sp.]|nr:3-deoxy-7-phosphoheptulonate synthase [Pseudobacteriovorax sp.]